jgi:hypothetical protein
LSGAISGCRKDEYDLSTKVRSSSLEISSEEMYKDRIATDRSTNEYDSQSFFQFPGSVGMCVGM